MQERLMRFFSSYRATIILMALYASMMAGATLIEHRAGTPATQALVYHSPLFILLHCLLAVNFICITLERKLYRSGKWGFLLVHGGFLVIMAGALTTHISGQEGSIHLREGEKSSEIMIRQDGRLIPSLLPFELELVDFRLERYPGSMSPSTYKSYLRIHAGNRIQDALVYMNHVLDFEGYRFFQASYDKDEKGSILSVNRDSWGRSITYSGYVILFAGLLFSFVGKGSRFRKAYRKLKTLSALLAALAFSPQNGNATVPGGHLENLGSLPVQSPQGRIVPLNTFGSELMRKLRIHPDKGYGPEKFLLEMMVYPSRWAGEPVIPVEKAMQRHFRIQGQYISYKDAFGPQGNYLFREEVETACRKSPSIRTQLDKEVLKTDEKVNLLHQLFHFRLVRIFPIPNDTTGHRWLAPGDDLGLLSPKDSSVILSLFNAYRHAAADAWSDGNWQEADRRLQDIRNWQEEKRAGLDIDMHRLRTEICYNRLEPARLCTTACLVLGGLLLLLCFQILVKGERTRSAKTATLILTAGIACTFVIHTCSLGMRWYISGFVPWSNAYETMLTLAWASLAAGIALARRSLMTCALSTLFGGVVLFVSGLNWMDPQITPLVPVLKSPWLMFHVAAIMTSYGFFGISCMLGTTCILLSVVKRSRTRLPEAQIEKLATINELSLILGLGLLTIGIFLGAVWANESWGRYWSWDPKETWALVTAIIYATILHYRWFKPKTSRTVFSLLSQLAFMAVLMTYFGVNYLLSGMHSYGTTGSIPTWGIVIPAVFFALPVSILILSKIRRKG